MGKGPNPRQGSGRRFEVHRVVGVVVALGGVDRLGADDLARGGVGTRRSFPVMRELGAEVVGIDSEVVAGDDVCSLRTTSRDGRLSTSGEAASPCRHVAADDSGS